MTLTSFRPGLTASLLALAVFGAGPAAAYDDREIERPTGGGGIGIGIDLFGILKAIQNRDGAEAQPEAPPLAKAGPQMPALAGMGRWQIDAVLKGGWPVVVSYLAPAGTAFEVSFEVEGQAPMHRVVEGDESGRGFVQFALPDNFGDAVRTGRVSFRAIRAMAGQSTFEPRLLGLGCGPLAVGSVAIDEVVFEPPTVRVGTGQQAFYGFHSKSDFNRAAVDFARLERSAGEIRMVKVRSEDIRQSVSRNAWVGRDPALAWNGQDSNASISRGPHLLLVRAWAPGSGDWVVAWSPQTVTVAP
ncbi:MAG: hypothetical protein H6950_13680 [Zoogloeaceae bacterium]|nr:hypothetical protein [Rhodocyclaceae bacterium]MCP5231840.1 hypothetical protein [Zoogloeaceae bacterium]MCP5240521.1 hypothetical protein [Zoogloeaceae bacterium]MCP5253378.1 hypothetical protein [Zoogloeaceae bacterium]MCP5295731.1 hypothetical protein [Zoogloeaceae bacterium]